MMSGHHTLAQIENIFLVEISWAIQGRFLTFQRSKSLEPASPGLSHCEGLGAEGFRKKKCSSRSPIPPKIYGIPDIDGGRGPNMKECRAVKVLVLVFSIQGLALLIRKP